MSSHRVAVGLSCAAVLALIAVGIAELRSDSTSTGGGSAPPSLTAAQTRSLLAGSPPALAALHAQAGEVLGGGSRALHARLTALKGYPIVINKWASWCVPCKEELGAFQSASAEYGRRVAFIGLDSADTDRGDAVAFSRSLPVSYPSYYDESGRLGEQVTDSSFTPVTVFIGRDGRRFIHQGQYSSLAKLEQDVRRYALNA
jgi:thiol-disulfide isomerase/thioredoxin